MVRNPPANAGDTGSLLGSGRSLGEGNSNPRQGFAWEVSRTEEPGGLQSMGLQKTWKGLSDKATATTET